MSKNEELRTIGSIFSFLKERNPLVLASMMSNSPDKDTIRFYYDKWIQNNLEDETLSSIKCNHVYEDGVRLKLDGRDGFIPPPLITKAELVYKCKLCGHSIVDKEEIVNNETPQQNAPPG